MSRTIDHLGRAEPHDGGLDRFGPYPDGHTEVYTYDAGNQRVLKQRDQDQPVLTFYGIDGKPMGDYTVNWDTTQVWFTGGGWSASVGFFGLENPNRLQSRGNHYPYGEQKGAYTPSFATYTRESFTNLDYAINRYYSAPAGRFISPDPYQASGGAADPGSWNRYGYVEGDPVNFHDPSGLLAQAPYPPGYCPTEYSYTECIGYGFIDSRGGSDGGGGGGGWNPCPAEPGFLPNPLCRTPIIVPPQPKPAPKAEPECFAQLKDRPVNHPDAAKVNAVHTFWWVQDSTGTQYIISGWPTDPNTSGTRYLNVSATAGSNNGKDSSAAHTHWSSGLSWINCDHVDAMVASARDWQSSHNDTIAYNSVGVLGVGGPNSNSAAHYFGVVSGFSPNPPRTAYGWWTPIVFP